MTAVLFWYTDVQDIVTQEVLLKEIWDPEWIDPASTEINPLKNRVTERVRGAMQIDSGDIPERVRTWIDRICWAHIRKQVLEEFTWKLANPLDLTSLSNSSHNKKTR